MAAIATGPDAGPGVAALFPEVDLCRFAPRDPAIMPIVYTREYADCIAALSYLRSVGEVSPRAAELAWRLASAYPGNYTAFTLRLECLRQIPSISFTEEASRTLGLLFLHPKAFQPWGHLSAVVRLIAGADPAAGDRALGSTALRAWWRDTHAPELLAVQRLDVKNYHAWNYRLEAWKLVRPAPWAEEMELGAVLIGEDLWNNSAWTYRMSCLRIGLPESPGVLPAEVEFCADRIARAPQNESAWLHMLGLIDIAAYRGRDDVLRRIHAICAAHASPSDPECVISPHAVFVRSELARIARLDGEGPVLAELYSEAARVDGFGSRFWSWMAERGGEKLTR